jgi:hypothetical protein
MFHISTATEAAGAGQLLALQYILSTLKCTCSSQQDTVLCDLCDRLKRETLPAAAKAGNVEIVQWLQLKQSVELSEEAMAKAISGGHTAMHIYLHVDTLRWLNDNGCPSDAARVRIAAAKGGSTTVMKYLQQQGVISTAAQLTVMLQVTGAYINLRAAHWLRQQGAQWPAVLKYGDDSWRRSTVAWARSECCTSPTE